MLWVKQETQAMKSGTFATVLVFAALTALAQDPADNAAAAPSNPPILWDFQAVEAPQPASASMPDNAGEAPAPTDENVAVEAVSPVDASSAEADGESDDAPDVANAEVEMAPDVDAAPAPDTEVGDGP
jgi:hypothetical protein